jgi:hypothetical protein
MAGIFISYRREDTAGYAGRLSDQLSAHFGAQRVFMDVSAIEPGADFVKAIEAKVHDCDAAVVLIGRNWLSTRLGDPGDFVSLEITSALQRDIPVIPVLVEGTRMPLEAELPQALTPLCRRQALELTNAMFHEDAQRLIEVLDRFCGVQTPVSRSPRSGVVRVEPEGWWRTAHGMLTVAAGIVAALVILIVIVGRHPAGALDGKGKPAPQAQEESVTAPKAIPKAASRYPVSLPAGAEIKVGAGAGVYKILAVQLDRHSDRELSLRFSIRETNNTKYDTVLSSNSFRLLVDGVPGAPAGVLSEVVPASSAKEGDVVFVIPDTPGTITFQVVNQGDGATRSVPVNLNGGKTQSSSMDHTAPRYPRSLPAGAEIKVGTGVYRILALQLDRYSDQELSLRFSIRETNTTKYDAVLSGSSFRLLVDGVPRAPIGLLNELVPASSAKEGDAVFVIPDTATAIELQVVNQGDGATRSVAVNLTGGKN